MGNHNESERNKNESEVEYLDLKVWKKAVARMKLDRDLDLDRIYKLEMENADLNRRIKALEGVFMRRFAPDTAEHPNDGGWFC